MVRDLPRPEPRLLRRREAEEELGAVRDEIRAGDARGDGHLLRQALPAPEAAAGEPAADARHREERQVEDRLVRAVDVVAVVAAQEHGDVVRLEDGGVRVAREAPRRQKRRLAGTAVVREMRPRLLRDVVLEVRHAPRDGDAEPCRRERVLGVERAQHVLEVALRAAHVLHVQRRGHDLAVQRRHEHLDALAVDAREVEHVLLGRHACRLGDGPRRRRSETVDELVDPAAGDRCRGRAADEPAPCEPHQVPGCTSTSVESTCFMFCRTRDALSYGLITCSLTV